jgi:hypothetical protein
MMNGKPKGAKRCITCWRPRVGAIFCLECGKSYDRNLRRSQGTMAEMLMWGVRRAFAMQRMWLARQEPAPPQRSRRSR